MAAAADPMEEIVLYRMAMGGKRPFSTTAVTLSLAWLRLHCLMSKIQSAYTSEKHHGEAVISYTNLKLKRKIA